MLFDTIPLTVKRELNSVYTCKKTHPFRCALFFSAFILLPDYSGLVVALKHSDICLSWIEL